MNGVSYDVRIHGVEKRKNAQRVITSYRLSWEVSGIVEEKMVDCACCVRITRYVDEIAYNRTDIEAILVLSKDIDLRPAVDYAVGENVPILVAAHDVVQHRGHPYALLGPRAFAEITEMPRSANGHEMRDLLARALHDGAPVPWTVGGTRSLPTLVNSSGLMAVPRPGLALPPLGGIASLCPIDATWDERILGSFPLLVCAATPGRLHTGHPRAFNPDEPQVLRVLSPLAKGGMIATDINGTRGLLTTTQALKGGAAARHQYPTRLRPGGLGHASGTTTRPQSPLAARNG